MAKPKDIGAIDTLIGFRDTRHGGYVAGAVDQGVRHPADYMFKSIPDELAKEADRFAAIDETVEQMDRYGVRIGMISLGDERTPEALRRYPDRFLPALAVDANQGIMITLDRIRKAVEDYDLRAVTIFPAGTYPQIPIDSKLWYPIYAKCAELDLAVFINAGVPGPRVPMMCQYVGHLDEVCYHFPELKLIMRHGAEPWEDLAVKLMLKWPNLYYSTSAFAPKYWPKAIVQFANTRGADKVIYGGYFPMGIELERIFREMEDVAFKDAVWPKFLHDNAARVLRLPPRQG
jgi:predicted TIM-barrel fold metal-dependent hydrolase